MNQVFMSALGRDVKAGDLYNYFSDGILTNGDHTTGGSKAKLAKMPPKGLVPIKPELTYTFLTLKPDEYKKRILGIDEHVQLSIDNKFLDEKDMWFDHFQAAEPSAYANEYMEKVVRSSLYIRVVIAEETLGEKQFDVEVCNYHKRNDGRATHIVETVVYGAEFLCLIHKEIENDDGECEDASKEAIRRRMKLATKKILDQVVNGDEKLDGADDDEHESNDILCTIFSSLYHGKKKTKSLNKLGVYLSKAIKAAGTEPPYDGALIGRKIRDNKWRPVFVTLRQIRDSMEKRIVLEGSHYNTKISKIVQSVFAESDRKLNVKEELAKRFPSIQRVTSQFKDVLTKIQNQWYSRLDSTKQLPGSAMKRELNDDLLTGMFDWLDERVMEIDMLSKVLLGDTQVSDWNSKELLLSKLFNKEDKKEMQFFVLKVDYFPNPVVERMLKIAADGEPNLEGVTVEKLPDFSFFNMEHEDFDKYVERLRQFADKAKERGHCPYILLAPSSFRHDDGHVILNVDLIQTLTDSLKQSKSRTPLCSPRYGDAGSQTMDNPQFGSALPSNSHQFVGEFHSSIYMTRAVEPDGASKVSSDEETTGSENAAAPLASTMALSQKGTPSVYSLNVNKRELGNNNVRWFDVEPPCMSTDVSVIATASDTNRRRHHHGHHAQHKVIILMGAAGSGKSTLVDGMVNYVLGVQWEDPYRFSVIQPKAGDRAKQSLSQGQTKTVTAYTLQHQHGNTVPYSLTIVDTPGYGDPGGVDVDKTITRNMHEFLSNRFHPIAKVHAVCFVAVSGDSRLTAAQRYILDSVLPSFGSDVKNNIRLLVTFADNSDPPFVMAYRSANVPKPSDCHEIPYCKFNSSVLFANNSFGDEVDNFDRHFWDMGQENFEKFFNLLDDAKGCSVASSERCNALEPIIRAVQSDLEHRLLTIENAELFVRKYNEYVGRGTRRSVPSSSLAANNFEVEFRETKLEKIASDNGTIYKNCSKCQKTCGQHSQSHNDASNFKPQKPTLLYACGLCHCDPLVHVDEPFKYRRRWETKQMKLVQVHNYYNSKVGFEKISNRDLLVKCSELVERTKGEVLRLLREACEGGRLSSSTEALRAKTLTVADCLYMMSSLVAQEDENNVTRLETFASLQQMLTDQEKGEITL